MWDAYTVGTIPVGAVLVDEGGAIVGSARNRIFDEQADGHFGRSRLAHAELNALVGLSSERTYAGFTLHTTLEPCHLCLSAAIAVRIGTVSFAASDRYGGSVGKLLPSEDHRAHPVAVEGPLTGPAGLLPELLHVAHFLWRRPDSNVAAFYRTTWPDLVAAAEAVPTPDAGAELVDAFAALPS